MSKKERMNYVLVMNYEAIFLDGMISDLARLTSSWRRLESPEQDERDLSKLVAEMSEGKSFLQQNRSFL